MIEIFILYSDPVVEEVPGEADRPSDELRDDSNTVTSEIVTEKPSDEKTTQPEPSADMTSPGSGA
jgi:hypothetical protein